MTPNPAQLDQRFVWHPFTQMKDWLRTDPIVLERGRGSVLYDTRGRAYLDANASIWTNLHGHNHPRLNRALREQLSKVAHVSALGFANPPASRLAAELVRHARFRGEGPRLGKVFFSDDGSTALEAAIKLAHEYTRRTRGPRPRTRFLGLEGGYHGDTLGAVSVGHSPLFHGGYRDLLFKADTVMSPYCYRCPYNRAKPERADARTYRSCRWECLDRVDEKLSAARRRGRPYSAFVVEPRIQGAAGMIAQPEGWLKETCSRMRSHGALIIADEVMTGFGRTGSAGSLFASGLEGLRPDFLCLAKGLTGGYLPMAATLTTQPVFDAFLGEYSEFKTFFHGHSFTGNPLGAATALESLALLKSPTSNRHRHDLEKSLGHELASLWGLPAVGDVRQVGLVAGVELVRNWRTRASFPLEVQAGIRVCQAMARRGVLTRPIGNVVVLMPPYSTTSRQLKTMVTALYEAIEETMGR